MSTDPIAKIDALQAEYANRIDIHDPITDIIQRLGLVPANVAEILFRPNTLTATVYEIRDGKKYLQDGKAVTTTHQFKVRT